MSLPRADSAKRDEIEVKIPYEDLDGVRKRLSEKGGALASPLHFESNDLFDDAEKRLSRSGCTLRLRRHGAGGEAILTYKGPASFREGLKVREERETGVSDAAEAEAILAALGLRRGFRYEKRREEWNLEGCSVALDETPIGNFVEVEGDPSDIRRAVVALELDFAAAIPSSYVKLYLRQRQENPKLPEDMIFPSARV